MWFAAGGAKRRSGVGFKHGVGILLHRRWAREYGKAVAVNERLLFIDLGVAGMRL